MSENQSEALMENDDNGSMFASVWVKVELFEGEDTANDSENNTQCINFHEDQLDTNKIVNKAAKRKYRPKKLLHCDLCQYTTVHRNCLEIHISGHTGEKPFVCELCSYATNHAGSLNRHILIKHPESSNQDQILEVLKCDHCDYTTNFKWNLNAHKRKHKVEKQFKCSFCDYQTAYRHNFLKHSRVHKDKEVLFKCDKCPFETKYAGHIERHLAKIHHEIMERANMCDMCDFSTKEKWRLNIHKQRSKKNNLVKCSYCNFETYYMCESKKHKSTHYSEIYGNGRAINCSNLNNEIKAMMMASEKLSKENDKMSKENDKIGKDNDKISKDAESVSELNEELSEDIEENDGNNSHAEIHHYTLDPECVNWSTIPVVESDDKDRPFQCHMCSYTSKFKASVQRHFQRHHTGTQNRPYKCRNCDFSTKTKDQIALHNKRSQSDTLLHCKICKFTTKFKCQHVLHQKNHYTHKCAVCNYTCKHKYELTKHYATLHMGIGLKCQYCEFTASRKESILCHETVHTGVKPFKCMLCDYSSVRKSLLDNHMKRYHKTIIKTDLTIVSEDKIQSLKIVLDPQDVYNIENSHADNSDVNMG